ncbi:MAG TPA: cation diffusion facilitator family transporter [Pseudonocardia sp.]|nr:cation diffusion facilitator family transporter [Pseudonocardia sp.]
MLTGDETSADRSPDARTLLLSVWASAGFAVLALVWGLALDSQLILFDGLYSFASVGLSLLAVLALRTADKGADERYPWGREAWEPLTIVVKAATLGGLCVYALVGGVADILRGGRDVDAGWALAYAAVASVGCVVVAWLLRRRARTGSGLVKAEAAEWIGDALLSVGVLVGFAVALILDQAGRSDLARYVDPVMVSVISAAFLKVPARLIAEGFRELLAMSPTTAILDRIRGAVGAVEREYGFTESFLRASKVGGRLDVEVDYVVDDTSTVQTVHQFDEVRAELERRLRSLGLVTSMSVGFTADRRWAL